MSEVIVPKTREEIFQEEHKEWLILYNRRKAAKWYQEHKQEKRNIVNNIMRITRKGYMKDLLKRLNVRLVVLWFVEGGFKITREL